MVGSHSHETLVSEVVGGCSVQLFYVPILRHFWYWLGVRRADRATMNQLLSEKTAVVLCPGGVQVRHRCRPTTFEHAAGSS